MNDEIDISGVREQTPNNSLRLASHGLAVAFQGLAIAVCPVAARVFALRVKQAEVEQMLITVTGRADAVELFAVEIAHELTAATQTYALGLTDEWPSVGAVRRVFELCCSGELTVRNDATKETTT